MAEKQKQQPREWHSIKAHLFQMCLVFKDKLNFKNVLEIKTKGKDREKNAKAWRAYDTLLYVLSKEEPKNKFSSKQTVEFLNQKLMEFWKEFHLLSLNTISET